MNKFTHFDESGQAHMVDVGQKAHTHRIAVATGTIQMQKSTFDMVMSGSHKKGDVIGIARIAAIQATKRAHDLIPLCHPIALTRVAVEFSTIQSESKIQCAVTTETVGQTGVEIEALTGVQIGLLTIYDTCKAVDRGMVISDVRLIEKSGGKSGTWTAEK